MWEDASHERTHLDPVLGEEAPRSCVRRGHFDPSQERTCLHPGQERTHLDPSQERTPRPCIRRSRGHILILSRKGRTSILCQHGREYTSIPNSMAQVLRSLNLGQREKWRKSIGLEQKACTSYVSMGLGVRIYGWISASAEVMEWKIRGGTGGIEQGGSRGTRWKRTRRGKNVNKTSTKM